MKKYYSSAYTRINPSTHLQSKSPKLPSLDSPPEIRLVEMFIRPFWRPIAHSINGQLSLFLSEEFGSFGEIREVEEDCNTDENGGNAFEDESEYKPSST